MQKPTVSVSTDFVKPKKKKVSQILLLFHSNNGDRCIHKYLYTKKDAHWCNKRSGMLIIPRRIPEDCGIYIICTSLDEWAGSGSGAGKEMGGVWCKCIQSWKPV